MLPTTGHTPYQAFLYSQPVFTGAACSHLQHQIPRQQLTDSEKLELNMSYRRSDFIDNCFLIGKASIVAAAWML
eukprot:642691-Amphidinium_carterae.2